MSAGLTNVNLTHGTVHEPELDGDVFPADLTINALSALIRRRHVVQPLHDVARVAVGLRDILIGWNSLDRRHRRRTGVRPAAHWIGKVGFSDRHHLATLVVLLIVAVVPIAFTVALGRDHENETDDEAYQTAETAAGSANLPCCLRDHG